MLLLLIFPINLTDIHLLQPVAPASRPRSLRRAVNVVRAAFMLEVNPPKSHLKS
jgi:hypothetical protein